MICSSSLSSSRDCESGEDGSHDPSSEELPRKSPPNSCVPCSTLDGSYLLSADLIQRKLAALPPIPANWKLLLGESTDRSSSSPSDLEVHPAASSYLSRTFVARNFKQAIASIQSMGDIAEELGHHPDFHLTQYRTVQVVIYTHKLRGVTDLDIELARLFNASATIDYSPKWLRENPF